MPKLAWGRGIRTAILLSSAFAAVACSAGGCAPAPQGKARLRVASTGHPLSLAVQACRRKLAGLGQQVWSTDTLASGAAGAEVVKVPSTLTGGPTTQSGIFAVYQALAGAEGMTLLPLLGNRAILVTLPAQDASGSFYCLVASGKVYAAWKTAESMESVDGRTLGKIVGNVWSWATRNHYYEPTPAAVNAGPEGVILSLAWAVNEGRPIAPYFDLARVTDQGFTMLQHWTPLAIQLLPQWSTSTMKEYEVAAWASPRQAFGQCSGFFQVAETSPGKWQIVDIGTGP